MANMYGNFVWWQGVVEDKIDPLMLGRCRVRILGYHTDDKTEIPTNCLPWATIMQPTTSAAISGIGTTPLGPVEGTWVIGFFRDGEDAQEPIIMGTIGGIPQEGADPQKGFNDPFGQYPKDDYLANEFREVPKDSHNYVPKAAEPDTNRLARGNLKIPTIDSTSLTDDSIPLSNGENSTSLKWKRSSRQEGVPKALAGNLSSSIENTNEKFYATNTGGTTTNLEENLDDFSIASVSITNGGSGYITAPTVTFIGGNATTEATATVGIDEDGGGDGTVTSVKMVNVGDGYTSVPTVTFSAPPEFAGNTQATGTVNIYGEDASGISKLAEADVPSEIDDPNYYWNEPHPRYGGVKASKTDFATEYSSCYPYNHVRQSESGHVEEWDDTPTVERLHRYHKSGTFEEIQADGTRIVKVTGNDYEIVAGEKNVLISGDCNITVEGNCRLKTVGSLVQEVTGNYHLNVHRDMLVKVGGNMIQEIMSARKVKVEKDDDLKVGKSQVTNIGINAEMQVGKDYSIGVTNHWNVNAASVSICGTTSASMIGIVTCDIMGATVGIGSALLTKIESDVAINVAAPLELHEVGIYNAITLGVWSIEAGGVFSLIGGVAGYVNAGANLGIGAAGILTEVGVFGVVVGGSYITLN